MLTTVNLTGANSKRLELYSLAPLLVHPDPEVYPVNGPALTALYSIPTHDGLYPFPIPVGNKVFFHTMPSFSLIRFRSGSISSSILLLIRLIASACSAHLSGFALSPRRLLLKYSITSLATTNTPIRPWQSSPGRSFRQLPVGNYREGRKHKPRLEFPAKPSNLQLVGQFRIHAIKRTFPNQGFFPQPLVV